MTKRTRMPRIVTRTTLPLCSHYRQTPPMRGLIRQGLADWVDADDEPGTLLLVHRPLVSRGSTLAAVVRANAAGILTVVDDDDNIDYVSMGEHVDGPRNVLLEGFSDGVPAEFRSLPMREYYRLLAEAQVKKWWPYRHDIRRERTHKTDETIGDHLFAVFEAIVQTQTRQEAIERAQETTPHEYYRRIIAAVDLLTVSCTAMAEVYAPLHPHIRILPNVIDLELPCYRLGPRVPHDGIILGWAGTLGHTRDIAFVAPILKALLRRYDGRRGKPLVRLMLGGDWRHFYGCFRDLPGMDAFTALAKREVNAAAEQQIMLQRFVTVESTCGRYIYRSFTALPDESPAMYADVDIGILPLVDDRSNRIKTDLKGLELAGMGVPCVASAVGSYPEYRGPGTGCILARMEQEWSEALRRLIEDAELRRRMGDEARRSAENRTIDVRAPRWMDVYTEALEEERRRQGAA